jgi:hypothetical protein
MIRKALFSLWVSNIYVLLFFKILNHGEAFLDIDNFTDALIIKQLIIKCWDLNSEYFISVVKLAEIT